MTKKKEKSEVEIGKELIAGIAPVWRYVTRYIERAMWQTFDDAQRAALKKAVLANEDAFIAFGIPTVTFKYQPNSDQTITEQAEAAMAALEKNAFAQGVQKAMEEE